MTVFWYTFWPTDHRSLQAQQIFLSHLGSWYYLSVIFHFARNIKWTRVEWILQRACACALRRSHLHYSLGTNQSRLAIPLIRDLYIVRIKNWPPPPCSLSPPRPLPSSAALLPSSERSACETETARLRTQKDPEVVFLTSLELVQNVSLCEDPFHPIIQATVDLFVARIGIIELVRARARARKIARTRVRMYSVYICARARARCIETARRGAARATRLAIVRCEACRGPDFPSFTHGHCCGDVRPPRQGNCYLCYIRRLAS
jgi:hypothetical protein